jgi:hypothetical protein
MSWHTGKKWVERRDTLMNRTRKCETRGGVLDNVQMTAVLAICRKSVTRKTLILASFQTARRRG